MYVCALLTLLRHDTYAEVVKGKASFLAGSLISDGFFPTSRPTPLVDGTKHLLALEFFTADLIEFSKLF